MFVKPRSAFVGWPSVVASSSGSAKNARYARLLPSTMKRSASRAGPSSSSSSAPVSVFGIAVRAYRPAEMPPLDIHPLSELRGEATALLAERYTRQLAAEPLLPAIDDFEPHVPEAGHVATRGGDAVAYLAGAVDGDMARWQFAGHAAREPEALRDLFAHQTKELGVSRFMLSVPATAPELIDAWFRLAFGCQAVWAVREVEPKTVEFAGALRLATLDDTEDLVDFDELLYVHQVGAPSFSEFQPPPREQLRVEVAEIWDDDK